MAINKAITTLLKSLGNGVFSPAVNSDSLPVRPFYVHKQELVQIHKSKIVTWGYEWKCLVTVIADSPGEVESNCDKIINKIEAVKGTISGVSFQSAAFIDESGRDYDNEKTKTHFNTLEFEIFTKNR